MLTLWIVTYVITHTLTACMVLIYYMKFCRLFALALPRSVHGIIAGLTVVAPVLGGCLLLAIHHNWLIRQHRTLQQYEKATEDFLKNLGDASTQPDKNHSRGLTKQEETKRG